MSLKMEFIERATKPGANVSALCREYGITRETGHKWLRRYRELGSDGLEERSRRPLSESSSTSERLVFAILDARERHPSWGPKKLVDLLRRKYGDETPSRVTIARILQRFGMVRRRRRRAPLSVIERAPTVTAKQPNEVWTVDFKGWWRTKDGSRSEPLTVRDAFSRFVLCVETLPATRAEHVRRVFERLFRRYGVPSAIQCDNGSPFISSQSRGGLTRLSAWWVALGIRIVRSRPGCPQDNGGHERMHRDIAADVEAYPDTTRAAAQRALSRWRQQFNHVRPHEALGGKVPAEVYRPGARRSLAIPPYRYPVEWTTRRVYAGRICVHGEALEVGKGLIGHWVALEPLADGTARMWLRDVDLGEITLALRNATIDTACLRYLVNRTKGRKAA